MYSNAQVHEMTNYRLVSGWAVASTVFYFLWLTFWKIWGVEQKIYRVGAFCLLIMVMILLPHIAAHFGHELPESKTLASVRAFMVMILMISIQFAMKSQSSIAKLQLEKQTLLSENLRVQLTALQHKVDPHFLFNSMNTLLAMVKRGNKNSEQFIISLSDFYRQTLKNNENTTLPISKELQVMKSYLFLMKSRNVQGVNIDIDVPAEVQTKHLPTLALQIALENCFKHNSMSSKHPLNITVQADDDEFITVTNNIQPKFGEEVKSGLGLDLLKKRYSLLGVEDAVSIDQSEDTFIVNLKMLKL